MATRVMVDHFLYVIAPHLEVQVGTATADKLLGLEHVLVNAAQQLPIDRLPTGIGYSGRK
ncbi:hypothetical protein D3C80_2175820 [compost metagenome]